MKFQIIVRNIGEEETWPEDYNKPEVASEQSARQWAEQTIERFNATLHPKEKPRELVGVNFGDGDAHEPHDWEKTNLITISGRNDEGSYDTARCKRCGITSRRYGVGGYRLDPEYKAASFAYCDTARELLKRRQQRKGGKRS